MIVRGANWQLFARPRTKQVCLPLEGEGADFNVTSAQQLICTLPPDLIRAIVAAYDQHKFGIQPKPPDTVYKLPNFGPLPDVDEAGTEP